MDDFIFDTDLFPAENEQDVCEEIVSPLLRNLGYRKGTINNITRQQILKYPKFFLGRKNPHKDPPLIGRADYICEANGQISWVIEAKAPNIEISSDDIEQAFSYANHPEIRAIYFCLTNGHIFSFFQTNHGPQVKPFLQIKYEDLNEKLQALRNCLSPESLLREHPPQNIDIREPLGPGLRSFAQIVNGKIRYKTWSINVPALRELIISITRGAIERNEEKKLCGYIETLAPYQQIQELNERLGLTKLEAISEDSGLSTNPEKPTIFESRKTINFSRGERLFDMRTFQYSILPIDLTVKTHDIITGYLDNKTFKGGFSGEQIWLNGMNVKVTGEFEAYLA